MSTKEKKKHGYGKKEEPSLNILAFSAQRFEVPLYSHFFESLTNDLRRPAASQTSLVQDQRRLGKRVDFRLGASLHPRF